MAHTPLSKTPSTYLALLGATALCGCSRSSSSPALPRPVTTSHSILATIPRASGGGASDREIDRWTSVINKNPEDANAWTRVGDALMQKGRETADVTYCRHSERSYARALELDPRREDALVGLAWVCASRHEFEQTVAWANKAIAIDPNDSQAYGLLGDAAAEMGDYDAAFRHVQKMLDIKPDSGSYSRGAHLLMLCGDTRKALWLMDKAVKTGAPYAENTAWCRAQKALILFRTGAYRPAEQVLTEALRLSPTNYQVLAAMGKVKAALKDYPAAIEFYRKAVGVAPQIDSLASLGDLYSLTGKRDLAEQQYAQVEAIQRLFRANGVRGDMQIALFYADHDRNLPEALRMAEAEYATRKNVYAADTLAWCYYKNRRFADAKRVIDRALSRKTPEALFMFHKGMILAKLGDIQGARMLLYQATSLSSQFHPIYASAAAAGIREYGSTPVADNVASR